MFNKSIILFLIILLFSGCNQKDNKITFNAIIEDTFENSILVTTFDSDNVDFKKASISYDEDLKLDFVLVVGQNVKITIQPEIRESYPVQVTATKIELITKDMDKKTEYKKITQEDAKKIIDSENVIILDVRTQEEYNSGHINNAIILPVTEISNKAQEILVDKNKKILIYCRSGNRSATAAKALIELGYNNVYDFGGINDWPYGIVK